MRIRLDNLVASAKFNTQINLDKIKESFENAVYDKSVFPALIIRFYDIGTTVLLFSSGKSVITGAKKMDQVIATVNRITKILSKYNYDVIPNVEIVNSVYTIETNRTFNLDKIALKLPNCEYDPEQFTGLIYKPRGLRTSLLVFSSGKMICSGAKDINDMKNSIKMFQADLEKYIENCEGDKEW